MKFPLGFILLIILVACSGEKAVKESDLLGKWNFKKALRNGKETKTLQEAYFLFRADSTVISNLFDEQEQNTFKIVDNKLKIDGSNALDLEIAKFDNDTMDLKGILGPFDMEFRLVRSLDTLSEQ